jgi:hypothetical protein
MALAAMVAVAMSVAAGEDRQGVPDPLLFSTFVGGGADDWPHAAVTGPNGTVYVAGYTLSYDFPTTEGAYQRVAKGNEEVMVLHLSADGSQLIWATLVGGSGQDIAWDLALGPDGKVYVTGLTRSPDFPTTQGAFLRTREGASDAFVLCLSPDGGSLVYSTLLGGEDEDEGYAIEVTNEGRAFVAGSTGSVFFPTTSGAHDRSLGGLEDVFVSRISSDGRTLEASTYLGGSYTEVEPSMALDASGNVWVAGSTTSRDFPTTAGLPNDWDFARDVFVASLGSGLAKVDKATVTGQEGSDVPRSIDIGPQGQVMVAGYTHSPEFPEETPDPGDDNSGEWDGFILVYNASLRSWDHARLYGGGNRDVVRRAVFGPKGLVHAVGYTNSTDFPTTLGSYKPHKTGDDHDMFYVQLDPAEYYSIRNSTYIGRMAGDFAMALAFDRWGTPVIAGHSRSADFPTEGSPYDDEHNGMGDIVVLKYTTDEDPPHIYNDTTPPTVDTGTHLNLAVDVTDATAVGDVSVSITLRHLDYNSVDTVELSRIDKYRASVYVGTDVYEVEYHFMAWDVLGHFNSTEPVPVTVRDTVPPTHLEDGTPAEGTTGDVLGFHTTVTDNWEVDLVWIEITQGDVGLNANMSLEGVDQGSYSWGHTIQVPADSIEPVDYRFHISDGAGNTVTTSWGQVIVRDDDAPVLGPLTAPTKAEPDTIITVSVSATDNIGLSRARVEYLVDIGQPGTVRIEAPLGEVLSAEVPVPVGRGDLHVTMIVEDAAGNEASVSAVVPFSDDTPPLLLNLVIPANATTGDPATLSWEVVDASEVQRSWLEYVFGDGREPTDFRRENADDPYQCIVHVQVPNFDTEPLYVRVGAIDRYGNSNETDLVRVDVVDDEVPRVDIQFSMKEPSSWKRVILDGSRSTDNLGITRYEWSYGPADGSQVLTIDTDEPEISLTMDRPGVYAFHLTVHDAAGNSNSTSLEIELSEDTPSGTSIPTWVLYLAAVAVLVVVGGVVLLQQRKKARPPSSGET